jgi:EmrB/QacA subfamily drug resistance transporter
MAADLAPPAMPADPPRALSPRETSIILVGVMIALMLAALDQTVIVTALPSIVADLGEGSALAWVVTAYLLTATATAPLYGKLADTRGRRLALFLALGLFLVGSVACALAPGMLALVLARALQGLGAGGLIAVPMTIVGDVVPPRERGKYQAYIAAVYATSSIAGPAIGGTLSEYAHWSLIFWINLPIGLLAFLVAGPALRRLPDVHRPHRLDIPGALLLVGSTSALLFGLTHGSGDAGWTSPVTLVTVVAALVLGVLFWVRLRRAAEPLIPVGVLGNRVVRFGVITAALSMGVLTGLSVVTPLFFEVIRGYSSSEAGIAVIPLMIATTAGATISGQLMSRIAHYKRASSVGLLWAFVALVVIAATFDAMPGALLPFAFAAVSIGVGTTFPVTTVAVQNAVARHEMGTATALTTFCRQLGGALVVAVFGAVLVAGGAGANLLAEHAGGGPAVVDPRLADAFRTVFLAAAGLLLAAFVSHAFIEERPLRGRD